MLGRAPADAETRVNLAIDLAVAGDLAEAAHHAGIVLRSGVEPDRVRELVDAICAESRGRICPET
jgi:hypothetical protein